MPLENRNDQALAAEVPQALKRKYSLKTFGTAEAGALPKTLSHGQHSLKLIPALTDIHSGQSNA